MSSNEQRRGFLSTNSWPPLAVALAAIGLAISALVTGNGNEILERAVEASAGQGSYRFEFAQSAGARGQTVAGISMQGLYDRSSGLSRLTLGFGGSVGGGKCTIIADENVWFVQIPVERRNLSEGKEWVRTTPLATSPAQGLASSPARGESFVDLAAVDDLEKAGRERIRGVETTRYRGVFDLAATFARVDTNPLARQQLERLRIPDKIPVDFWIDDNDLIRRTSYSFSVPSGPVRVQTKLRYDAYDFGVQETVTEPPPETVSSAPGTPGFTACLTPADQLNR